MAKICIIIIILYLIFTPSFSQTQNIKFEHISIEQGLSECTVHCIIHDTRGFIWCATQDGLNKFDGYKFTIFKNDPDDSNSLSDNNVIVLYEDQSGTLWIGTNNGGLNKYDREKKQFIQYKHDPNNTNSLSNNSIRCISEDQMGILWIGTDNGLNKFDQKKGQIKHYFHDSNNSNSLSNNAVWYIYEDHMNTLWIGTRDGLNRFNQDKEQFIRYKYDPNNPNSLSDNYVRTIYDDKSGNLWIGTDRGGLNKFDREKQQFIHYRHDPNNPHSLSNNCVLAIFESPVKNRVLWIGTEGGLNRFDPQKEEFIRYQYDKDNPESLSSHTVFSIIKDRSGAMWLGTYNGINKLALNKEKFKHYKYEPGNPNSLSSNIVKCIYEDQSGTLWIGTYDGGLNKFDREKQQFEHYRHDPDDPYSLSSDGVAGMFEDKKGLLWIQTAAGLNIYDRENDNFVYYDAYKRVSDNEIGTIYQDRSGELWIGSATTLNKFDRDTEQFVSYQYDSLSNNPFWAIHEDQYGALWLGVEHELIKFDRGKVKFRKYKHDPTDTHSLINSIILSIYEDQSGTLWIGTARGLLKFDRYKEQFTHYREKDGLPSDVVYATLEDKRGNLWLSTNNGVARFNPKSETFRNYDIHDGLQSNEFTAGAYYQSKSGEMFFGGINGCNSFHPDSIKDNPYIPPIVITDFKIFNKSVSVGETHESPLQKSISETNEIRLSHQQSVFSFEFAALDYTAPEKNKYAYRMEGVDPDWVYTDASRRYATYTQLAPGTYNFTVKGSNNDWIWNDAGCSITIIIIPPWWRTGWAYAFYFVLLCVMLYALRFYDLKRQRLKHELQLKAMHAEKLEEVDRMKSRFFANISHEFRTPLTLIQGPIKQILTDEFKGNLKEQCKMILRNSQRLLHLINQLLDLSKLESGNFSLKVRMLDAVALLKRIVMSFSSLSQSKQISLNFVPEKKSINMYIDSDVIEKIVSNLLSNALKFTTVGGTVDVVVSKKPTPMSPPGRGLDAFPSWEGLGVGKSKDMVRYAPTTQSVQITITNTGTGIPPDKIDKIFDRFFQVEDTTMRHFEGTGIGLALTKELVELHHGKIDVVCRRDVLPYVSTDSQSQMDMEMHARTTFTVWLPIDRDYYSADEIIDDKGDESTLYVAADQVQVPLSGGDEGVGSETHVDVSTKIKILKKVTDKSQPIVLIVEDNPDMRNYIEDILNHQYHTITAAGAVEGYTKAVKIIPDLIVSDVMMPEMDGFELCKKLKSNIITSHIPLILLTARTAKEDKISGLETGADDYIAKPFDSDELLVRIKNLIEQRRLLRKRFSEMKGLDTDEIAVTATDERFLKRAMAIIEENISDPKFSGQLFGKEVGMSRMQLHRKIKALTDQSPHMFIRLIRLKRAANMLREQTGNVAQIAYEVGFNSPAHFAKAFREYFGQTPSDFIGRSTNKK